MVNSMTAFGREEADSLFGHLVWEIRTVNHRYQEISIRLPDELRSSEPDLRRLISSKIHRGRVDAILHYQVNDAVNSGKSSLNYNEMRRLAKWESEVLVVMPNAARMTVYEILRWPGVLGTPTVNFDELYTEVSALLNKALERVLFSRQREGQKLADLLLARLTEAKGLVAKTESIWPQVEEDLRRRLDERIANLDTKLEPNRLEQELILLLSKADIREEIERLILHFDEVDRVLTNEGPVGRRLDFLMQELHREANTIGSKASHVKMTSSSVDLKVVIEQMREQVQNVE
ncbi:MAG: YicC family protein [Gammaproteobacteria bacterium]|nr:YicC family protein [Gammaproteobacteria bacterium]